MRIKCQIIVTIQQHMALRLYYIISFVCFPLYALHILHELPHTQSLDVLVYRLSKNLYEKDEIIKNISLTQNIKRVLVANTMLQMLLFVIQK